MTVWITTICILILSKQVAFRPKMKNTCIEITKILCENREKSRFAFIKYCECFITTNLPITKRIFIELCVKRFMHGTG